MSNQTGLEAETQNETTTFEHFGREWTVPTQRHLTHLIKMRNEIRAGYSDYNLLVADTMLSEKQFLELCEIDPDETQLNEFVGDIVKAMGMDKAGNS